ncbi:PhnD/SsuA/transferrin family substrate-binding protein [Siminovitchia sp. FSL H7-0308]|uniref:Phosphonate transport system substrate-binding protein n=1 Tax=Siminovitchia thermophila TaxID=1245522 RepID=A0ABS2R9R9_9BACI|nr:PhnD/SsuA/transferrin family substrate-binding protein [Siminovitchia thermophila]MBM7715924.1 phosphonate transport system substrate-binding protein [Siminovitchia thermophila]ONK21558.1 phosphonate ABC transporter substrate-binding protein [Bacillus sp. VT-16-64]
MKKSFLPLVMLIVISVFLGACSNTKKSASSEEITMVWYPNESGNDLKAARDEIGKVIEEATGKKVTHKLTTDYAVAIETIANGNAQMAFMGAQGYIEAKNKSEDIEPVVVPSGASGTLEDAVYHSWLAVRAEDAEKHKENGEFTIDKIVDSKFSFVSNSSTSGFKVPSNSIVTHFSKQDQWKDLTPEDLMEGGKFFKEVLYGDSHQGSAVNLLSKRADVAAFCDTCVGNYVEVADGEENTAGSTYKVRDDAAEPFNTLTGEEFTLISVTPVLNAPFVANASTLSEEDFKKIQESLASDEVANNETIFVPEDSEQAGLFKKTDKERFVVTDDAWFDPIRELAK